MPIDDDRPRLLVIGGSGLVGQLIIPDLAQDYRVRVLDPNPPAFAAEIEHVAGSSSDFEAVRAAVDGTAAFVYLAMGPKDPAVWERPDLAALHYDISVKGMYVTTRAAGEAGVLNGVYASSLSVFEDYGHTDGPIGDIPPDSVHFYGLAKRLGEEVAKAAVRRYGMNVIALRLALPMADADLLALQDPYFACVGTAGSDVSRAFRAALRRTGDGFQAVAISGDRHSRYADMKPARDLLGWEPRVQPPPAP